MTNPKLEKVKADIEKVKARITDYQGKLRDLERKKTDLENEDIVALVRREKITDAELNALLRTIRKDDPAIAIPAENKITAKKEEDKDEYIEN